MQSPSVTVTYHPCASANQGRIAVLSLDRPSASNAFNGPMVKELMAHLKSLSKDPSCRLVVVRGKGKSFCSGADLSWMKEQSERSAAENLAAAEEMAEMFRLLAHLPCPTVGVAQGAVFGGGVGLIACCDIALAADDARFCLSEVKIGLLPAVILPYLARKISLGHLKRLAFSGAVFSASQAHSYGLVEQVCPADELLRCLDSQVNALLAGAPHAQRRIKELLLRKDHEQWRSIQADLPKAIAEARSSKEGQEGFQAFFAKKSPQWTATISADWNC